MFAILGSILSNDGSRKSLVPAFLKSLSLVIGPVSFL